MIYSEIEKHMRVKNWEFFMRTSDVPTPFCLKLPFYATDRIKLLSLS